MTVTKNRRVRNDTGTWVRREHCAYCHDSGWVELAGTVTWRGTTYERGVTACRWCDEGVDHFNGLSADAEGRVAETNYSEADLAYPPLPAQLNSPPWAVVRRVGIENLGKAIGRQMEDEA